MRERHQALKKRMRALREELDAANERAERVTKPTVNLERLLGRYCLRLLFADKALTLRCVSSGERKADNIDSALKRERDELRRALGEVDKDEGGGDHDGEELCVAVTQRNGLCLPPLHCVESKRFSASCGGLAGAL